jgi:hypothetical protein
MALPRNQRHLVSWRPSTRHQVVGLGGMATIQDISNKESAEDEDCIPCIDKEDEKGQTMVVS